MYRGKRSRRGGRANKRRYACQRMCRWYPRRAFKKNVIASTRAGGRVCGSPRMLVLARVR